ncbi:MAG: DUF1599 domain-containing protein [Patescibacteria group bacterium]|nr:DUF1599 domain-containing protein [Patescibacteria group bacterium]
MVVAKTLEDALRERCDEVLSVVARKNSDYGTSNIAIWGALGVGVRLTDKVMRLRNLLTTGRAQCDESLRDTAVDIVGYGLILLLLLDGEWGLRMESAPTGAPEGTPASQNG